MKRFLRLPLLSCLAAVLLTVTAFADTGPKDQLVVKVENAPEEPYYLDILAEGNYGEDDSPFDGVVMTDDLAMDAVSAYAADGAVAVMALEAGNDLVLTTDYRTQIPKVIEAVENGTLDVSVIDTACRRVLRWKQALGLLPTEPEV